MNSAYHGFGRLLARAVVAVAVSVSVLPAVALAQEHEFAAELTEIASSALKEVATHPVIIDAIRKQNAQSSTYDAARIEQLDSQWRAEVGAASKPLIDATLGTDASIVLKQIQEESAGLITEMFVMDAKGLNVAQSTITSDYWQGDEEKFTGSFGAGAAGINLGEIEEDESTQTFQSQVSITIVDPDSGAPIGAVTAGVDLSML